MLTIDNSRKSALNMGYLACTGDIPTTFMMVGMTDRAYHYSSRVILFHQFEAIGAAMFFQPYQSNRFGFL
jgi:hypothetical protein